MLATSVMKSVKESAQPVCGQKKKKCFMWSTEVQNNATVYLGYGQNGCTAATRPALRHGNSVCPAPRRAISRRRGFPLDSFIHVKHAIRLDPSPF